MPIHACTTTKLLYITVDLLCSYTIPPEPVDDGNAPSPASVPVPTHTASASASATAPTPMDMDVDMNLDPLLREISRTSSPSVPATPIAVATAAAVPAPATPTAATSNATASSSSSSGLRLFPPPLFSRQAIPQGYKCVPIYALDSKHLN